MTPEVGFGQLGYEAMDLSLRSQPAPTVRERSSSPGGGVRLGAKSAPATASRASEDQFMLFQLADGERPLRDLTEVEPTIPGEGGKADAAVRVSLLAFHLAQKEARDLDDKSRATLRFDLGKDKESNSVLEPLFWSIAAGLDLYQHAKAGTTNATDPKTMSEDFSAKLRRRPIEIPGGLGQLRIEIMQHREPPWWRKALSFAGQDKNLQRLISSVGFPGIALDAVRLLDEALGRFEEGTAKPILQSRPLTLAFTRAAREDYVAGAAAVRVGSIAPGHYVLVSHADSDVLTQNPPVFVGTTGHLIPKKLWEDKAGLLDPEDTPFRNVTYAVLRFRAEGVNLSGP